MGWKTAEATPRKIMVDSGFMHGLCNNLGWDRNFDPSLSDLHPSLGNMDHAHWIINDIQNKIFPKETGFEGQHEGFVLTRTVHSSTYSTGNSRNPADSTGIRQTQIPECLGVTRAQSASLFQEESGGVHWKPAYSSGVRGIRLDFFRWASPLDSGGVQRTPVESSGISGIQWNPVDSSRAYL